MDALAIMEQLFTVSSVVPTIEFFAEVSSTNEVLWGVFEEDILAGEEIKPRVAIAQCQTVGRGQWGKSWTSSEGGLYLSMLVPIELDPQDAYGLTIASVWGITKYLREKAIPVEIKWANDLILDGKKLGGIKTETKIQAGKVTAAVIGVGINYSNEVPDIGINLEAFWNNEATAETNKLLNQDPSLGKVPKAEGVSIGDATNGEPTPNPSQEGNKFTNSQFPIEHLAAAVIAGISEAIAKLQKEGMASILPEYLKLLKNLGEMIVYEGHLGKIVGVNEKGELLVRMEAEGSRSTIKIPPGGVSLGYDS